MIKKSKQNSFFDRIKFILKNNIKVITFISLFILLIILLYQYYFYQKEQKPLKLSKLYDQVDSNFNSSDFEETMSIIAKENGIFGILASLKIINKSLKNNDYYFAYNQYIKLLKNNKSKKVYNSIIALHGSYNLIDYISEENILNLLTFVDESSVSFIGYKYEIEYLLSIMNSDIDKKKQLFNIIVSSGNISEKIKGRVKKIDEFEKYQ